jgi:preprotein translocase SecF subunit
MVELFRNPKINWIGLKKPLIAVTIVLLLLGATAVQIFGFNLGVDFTGGTLMTVRFKEQPSLDAIRGALADSGIDTSKVTLQPVTNRPNEIMIRAPQLTSASETERRVDEDKRAIIRALRRLNATDSASAGKINLNSIDAYGLEQELRIANPLAIDNQVDFDVHPYAAIAQQIIFYRDQQKYLGDLNGVLALDLSSLSGVTERDRAKIANFDQARIKEFIAANFDAGEIDINLAGTREVIETLDRIDPARTGAGSYQAVGDAVARFRKEGAGVISSLGEVPGITPETAQAMDSYFTEGSFAVISAEVVGAVVGADLRNRAIYVTLAALAGMLIYLAFRFEWIYGVAAVIAVFHDVLVTLGFFSLFQWEISLTVIASLLTLIGYSMNDTIVIFDRIRENLRLRRKDSLVQIANDSINETLSRTVITQGLTFISVVAIVLFGGEVLRGFALALTIGIIVGTYSTIAVASPIMLWWNYITSKKRGRGNKTGSQARATEREQTLARV